MKRAKQGNAASAAVDGSEGSRGKACSKTTAQGNPACERDNGAFGKGEPYLKEAAQPTGSNDVWRTRPRSVAAQKKQQGEEPPHEQSAETRRATRMLASGNVRARTDIRGRQARRGRERNYHASRARRSGTQRKHNSFTNKHELSHSLAETHEQQGKQAALRSLKRKHKARQQTEGRRAKNRRAKRERKEAAPSKKNKGFASTASMIPAIRNPRTANRPQKRLLNKMASIARRQTQGLRAKNRRASRARRSGAQRKN